jgi:hypothetical protein
VVFSNFIDVGIFIRLRPCRYAADLLGPLKMIVVDRVILPAQTRGFHVLTATHGMQRANPAEK